MNKTLQETQHHLLLNTCSSDVYSYINGAKGVEFRRDAMSRPNRYPATTKLSLAIIMIKQLNVCVRITTVVISAASEIGHTIDITWKVKVVC